MKEDIGKRRKSIGAGERELSLQHDLPVKSAACSSAVGLAWAPEINGLGEVIEVSHECSWGGQGRSPPSAQARSNGPLKGQEGKTILLYCVPEYPIPSTTYVAHVAAVKAK